MSSLMAPLALHRRYAARRLRRTWRRSRTLRASSNQRYAIISDLHIGDGSRRDIFRRNAEMVRTLFERYVEEGRTVILNGDIEECQNFTPQKIFEAWPEIFDLMRRLAEQGRLIKILGNHDEHLEWEKSYPIDVPFDRGVRLEFEEGEVFVFHGHQAARVNEWLLRWLGYFVRFVACPIGIENKSRSRMNAVDVKLERRVIDFSRERQILSVIGHTHRALFGSISSVEALGYKIDHLSRRVGRGESRKLVHFRREMEGLLRELYRVIRFEASREGHAPERGVSPVLFNSGCTIRPGYGTTIEIEDGDIALVQYEGRRGLFRKRTVKRAPLRRVFAKMRGCEEEARAPSLIPFSIPSDGIGIPTAS